MRVEGLLSSAPAGHHIPTLSAPLCPPPEACGRAGLLLLLHTPSATPAALTLVSSCDLTLTSSVLQFAANLL